MPSIRNFILASLALFLMAMAVAITETSAQTVKQPALHATSVFRGTQTATVALVQLGSENAGKIDVVEKWVAQAKSEGAVFVVFPESSYLGWLNPTAFTDATVVPGPLTDQLSKLAIKYSVYIAFGFAERGTKVSDTVYLPYDAGVLIGPDGKIILHSRKYQVLKNAFNPDDCPEGTKNPGGGCNYLQSPADLIPVADTPLGKTAILVCADAYTYDTAVLDRLKSLGVQSIIVVWGVAAGQQDQCGTEGFNAVGYASQAAKQSNAMVIGANAVGERPYGRFLPSVYCGFSGIVAADGTVLGKTEGERGVFLFDVPLP